MSALSRNSYKLLIFSPPPQAWWE